MNLEPAAQPPYLPTDNSHPKQEQNFVPVISEACVATANGSRYLQQLCKHWSHNLDVSYTADHATIRFPHDARGANWTGDAIVTLTAGADSLLARIEASEDGQLAALKTALANHLDRFAFREAPLGFDWQDAP